MNTRDLYIAANQCIELYGKEAGLEAAMKADEMLAKGDIDGQRVWQRIIVIINELQAESGVVH